eukprot:scaffold2899_cov85-Skeletonema_dohrnii-CCMP3373.AAC.12
MGRKRNQGKARKAAKAKAREEATEDVQHNESMTSGRQQSLATQTQQLHVGAESPHDTINCNHGFDPLSETDSMCFQYANAFREAYNYKNRQDCDANLSSCLIAAHKATTLDRFADLWNDSAKMEIVISYYLSEGTQYVLEGNFGDARTCTVFARYLEQCTAVELKQTQALVNWGKICEANIPLDIHTVVKFFRRRIPCRCLDKKYEQVKGFKKLGHCYNPDCPINYGQVERSKTFYCSRCRNVTYCSRECQKADWTTHKHECDECVARIAEFEAKK